MHSQEIRTRFLDFFAKRGHTIVHSSSLIPDDPSVLLTTAGMQQFKPYYTGQADPYRSPHPTLDGKPLGSQRAASCQKSFRTSDIDEVGDEKHLTFFEMLGNFSFGPLGADDPADFGKNGYFKRSAIIWAHELITKEFGLKINYVSTFKGEGEVPRDEESYKIWHEIDPKLEVREFGRADNFWGPTGNEGPCGPTTEIYVKGVEIWNLVFNEYYQHPDGRLEKLRNPGVDTGAGLERLTAVLQGVPTIFETDLFKPIVSSIVDISAGKPVKRVRLIADHLRAATFLIGDDIIPGKEERNYIPRRLIRDAMTAHYLYIGMGLDTKFFKGPVNAVIDSYKESYPYLLDKREEINLVMSKETEEFSKVLKLVGNLSDLGKLYDSFDPPQKWANVSSENNKLNLSGKVLFRIRETTGVSWSIMKMVIEKEGFELSDNVLAEYNEAYRKHQEISRAGAEAKFGGHGLYLKTGELTVRDSSELEKVTRLHTATHLLHAALRAVLGPEVRQNGSDITVERTRFDFTFPRKLTPEELKRVEDFVNEKIREDLPVSFQELPIEEAKKTGALWFFKEKYPPVVKVYSVGNFSKEFCGGPHVEHTATVGKFRITKEEAVSAGVRRIRAIVEP